MIIMIRCQFRYSLLVGNRFKRFSNIISSTRSLTDKSSQKPSTSTDLSQTQQQQQHKIIEAKLVEDLPKNQSLIRMKKLSSKNFLLKFILKRPIELIEWIESPKEKKQNSLIVAGIFFLGGIVVFILIHFIFLFIFLHKHEITDREFFNTTFEGFYELYEKLLLQSLMKEYEGKFLDSTNPMIQNGDRILRKILESNRDYLDPEQYDNTWSVVIIDDETLFNYEIISEKFIVLSKKLTELCENEHQLAYLIAHSLCHAILKHFREPLSNVKPWQQIEYIKLIVLIRMVDIFNPSEMFKNIEMMRPLNKIDETVRDYAFEKYRKKTESNGYHIELEQETERIALQLLSRACFDIREVKKFIEKYQKLVAVKQVENNDPETIDRLRYILQHKINDPSKLTYVNDNLEKFIRFRSSCGCDPLK